MQYVKKLSMPRGEVLLALSSRGLVTAHTSGEELLISHWSALLSTTMTPKHGTYSVRLAKSWAFDGEEVSAITATLNFRVEPARSPEHARAVLNLLRHS